MAHTAESPNAATPAALAVRDGAAEILERTVIQGDLSRLTAEERVDYYRRVCESLGLNPYTKPFEYLLLKDDRGGEKLILYPRAAAAEQLRDIRRVSITRLETEQREGLILVRAYAVDKFGRTDSAIGAVPTVKEQGEWQDVKDRQGRTMLKEDGAPKRRFVATGHSTPLTGLELANAIMKAETKAKRRVTLSLCGLGGLPDESEFADQQTRVIPVELRQTERLEQTPADRGRRYDEIFGNEQDRDLDGIPPGRALHDGRTIQTTTGEVVEDRADGGAHLPSPSAGQADEGDAVVTARTAPLPGSSGSTQAFCVTCGKPIKDPLGKPIDDNQRKLLLHRFGKLECRLCRELP